MKILREWRKTAGLTQEALASEIGAHQSQISSWESGESNPGPANQVALSRALRIPLGTVASAVVREATGE